MISTHRLFKRLFLLTALAMFGTPLSAWADGFYIKPHIQNITQDGATIIWETKDAGIGAVEYGKPGALNKHAADATPVKIHRVRLTGLKPESKYAYRVTAGQESLDAEFRTAPKKDRPVTFVAMGDTKNWADRWQATNMAGHTLQWKPELYFDNGDLVERGHNYELWPTHFQRFETINSQYMIVPARGNHEGSLYTDKENDWFAKYHELPGQGEPFVAFDWGNTHFVIISMDDLTKASTWLDEHLKSVTKRWVIVMQHAPVYCTGYRTPNDSRKEPGRSLAALAKTLDKYHVILDLSGHTHIYERIYPMQNGQRDSAGTTYVVNGGGINANYPEPWTAFADDTATMAPPTYTLVHCGDDRIDLKTFCWSPVENAIHQIDHAILWKNESVPAAAAKKLAGRKQGGTPAAIEELGAMAYAPAAKTITPFLASTDIVVRRAAATACRSIGAPDSAEVMLPLLKDPDATIRSEAARYFEIVMPEAMAPQVLAEATNPQQETAARVSLVGALHLHAPKALARQTALQLLDLQQPVEIRRRAAHALLSLADRGDVPALVERLQLEPDPYTLLRVAYALNKLTGTEVSLDAKSPLAVSRPGERTVLAKPWLDAAR